MSRAASSYFTSKYEVDSAANSGRRSSRKPNLAALSLEGLKALAAELSAEWQAGKLTDERCRLALYVAGEATGRLAEGRAS